MLFQKLLSLGWVPIYAFFEKIIMVRVRVWILSLGRINIKVIGRITVRYVMFRVGFRARIAILYLRAGANKLSFFQ